MTDKRDSDILAEDEENSSCADSEKSFGYSTREHSWVSSAVSSVVSPLTPESPGSKAVEDLAEKNEEASEKLKTPDNTLQHSKKATSSKEKRRKTYKTEDKGALSSQANQLVVSRKLFAEIQAQMGLWLGENYGRMIDLFRRFDEDHSGKLSYDEFFQGLKELEAPLTVVEMYLMALTLDADNDGSIDYKEFNKIKTTPRRQTAAKPRSLQPVVDIDKSLPPCAHCNLGISDPFIQDDNPRFVMVQFKCFTFLLDKNFHGHFRAKLSTSMSVYSIKKLILRELGSSATNLTVSTGNALGSYELMDEDKRLENYGIVGDLDNEDLPEHTLFYDFEYPMINCPIMNADF